MKAPSMRLVVLGWALAMVWMGCGASRPVTLYPALGEDLAAHAVCPATRETFFVSPVVDKRGYGDPRYVGSTRARALRGETPLLSDPPPAELLREGLRSLLLRCHNLTGEQNRAAKELRTTLLRYEVVEVGSFPAEQIEAHLVYEIEIVRPDWVVEHRAVVTAEASVGANLDSQSYAAEVLRTALETSIADLSLKLPRY